MRKLKYKNIIYKNASIFYFMGAIFKIFLNDSTCTTNLHTI